MSLSYELQKIEGYIVTPHSSKVHIFDPRTAEDAYCGNAKGGYVIEGNYLDCGNDMLCKNCKKLAQNFYDKIEMLVKDN